MRPGGAAHLERAVLQDRHPRGVVAAVLELLQSVDDDADGVLLTDIADDSTAQAFSFFRARAAPCGARPTVLDDDFRPLDHERARGTSLVTTEPAPICGLAPMVIGATRRSSQ